jgi:hypothetical protein
MGECRDEQRKGRDRGDETVNEEGVDEGDLQIHEIDREAHTQGSIGKRRETQLVRERIEREQRRQAEHIQLVDDAVIPHRQAENARIRAVRDLVASIDGRRTPERLAVIELVGIIEGDAYPNEREHEVWRVDYFFHDRAPVILAALFLAKRVISTSSLLPP